VRLRTVQNPCGAQAHHTNCFTLRTLQADNSW
jgi:hypothetical protein